MKIIKELAIIALTFISVGCTDRSVGDGEYLIEGFVRNIPDSTVINLLKSEGRMMSLVAADTVIGGRFEFRDTISGEAARLGICSFSEGFPNLSLPVWVKPGEKVKITGEDNLLLTWTVKSQIPEQKTENDFLSVQFPEKRQALAYAVEEADILRYLRGLQGEERRAAWRKVDSLRRLYEPLDSIAELKVLEYMRTAPVSTRWMEELAMVARSIQGGYMSFDNDLIQELYSRLSPADLESEFGQVISASLNPQKVVKVGDAMADGDLYDVDGNLHHLAEFTGKFILLDFWSLGCGPCMQSVPEGNEVARKYSDKLAFVRVGLDPKDTWLKAVKEKKSDCYEWNELKSWGIGLTASYQVSGIPHFVLISPEAKVIDTWTGYGKGSLHSKVQKYLEVK